MAATAVSTRDERNPVTGTTAEGRHLVFGAGLVGGYLAGGLLAAGQTVSVVARPRVRQKLEHGLVLTDLDGHRAEVPAPAWATAADAPPDFLWLTVKCTQVVAALDDLAGHVGTGTTIICCQNGIGSEKSVMDAFRHQDVLRCMVPFNVAELAAGHLHRGSGGTLTIESQSAVAGLDARIGSPLMPVALSQDIEAVIWAKLQLNLVNAVNALSDVPVRAMLEQRGYRRAFAACMGELLAVTNALGLRLPRLTALPAALLPRLLSLPDPLFRLLARPMLEVDPTVRTSMWWDLSQRKPTEVGYLNGAVVRHGRRVGVPTPVNERIVALVQAASESGAGSPGLTPPELLEALALN
jgi:2-dehydropantoate 2-reductase